MFCVAVKMLLIVFVLQGVCCMFVPSDVFLSVVLYGAVLQSCSLVVSYFY